MSIVEAGHGTITRRRFLSGVAVAGAGLAAADARAQDQSAARQAKQKICAFVKPLTSLDYAELADRMAEIGFDGIEAPMRDFGALFGTEQIPVELPKLSRSLEERGLEITIWASTIRELNPVNERALRTAADHGIRRYRLGGFQYDMNRPLWPQLENLRSQLEPIGRLNEKLGLQGMIQIHAGGDRVGAPVWDLVHLLKGIPPEQISVAFDIRHATVGGGQCWPLHFRAIRDAGLLGMVYVKDAVWLEGGRSQDVENVPLGEGMVQRSFFTMLKDAGYSGPISLHEEYLDHNDPALVPKHLAAFRRDLATLRSWLHAA